MTSRRDILKLALAAPWLAACGGGNRSGGSEQPISTSVTTDDWPEASPASQGIPASAMQALFDDGASLPYLYGLVVVRNGQLIGERYYSGAKVSDLRSLASVTKTISSLLVGQALAEGKIKGTADTLRTLLPAQIAQTPNVYAAGITLQQLLDMRGGQQWNEEQRQLDATNAPDMTAFALALPSDGSDGTRWNYTTASSHLLSPILATAYGMDELAVANGRLFGPLGISASAWSRDATGTVHGSFGLELRTRDLAKIGWMALDGGNWQGRNIVPATWLADSHAGHVTGLGDDSDFKKIGYGNLWWNGTLGGQRIITGWGYGGQFMMLVPALRMVIASAAELNVPYQTAGSHETVIHDMLGRFIRAAASIP
ncbi:MAG: serine hydrolase [Pseudomonadota bacterium]